MLLKKELYIFMNNYGYNKTVLIIIRITIRITKDKDFLII